MQDPDLKFHDRSAVDLKDRHVVFTHWILCFAFPDSALLMFALIPDRVVAASCSHPLLLQSRRRQRQRDLGLVCLPVLRLRNARPFFYFFVSLYSIASPSASAKSWSSTTGIALAFGHLGLVVGFAECKPFLLLFRQILCARHRVKLETGSPT